MNPLHEQLPFIKNFTASVIFSFILFLIRVIQTDSIYYLFLFWNLFLACIPYAIVLLLSIKKTNTLLFWLGFLIWLAFLPNSPYILTDIQHIKNSTLHNIWFDALLIISIALNGLVIGFVSLRMMQTLLQEKFSVKIIQRLTHLILLLCGFGMYLGRVLRWNSWDIIHHPIEILSDITKRFVFPIHYIETWIFTMAFGGFLILTYRYIYNEEPRKLKKRIKIKQPCILILTFLTLSCQSQTVEIQDKTIDYYFEQIAALEIEEMIKQQILLDSSTIAPKYKDSASNGLNQEAFLKYATIKAEIYTSFFKDYLYQQKVAYNNDYYILYFTMAGFDDMQWDIIKMPKDSWNGKERLSREKVENNNLIEKIIFNYDEGPKNIENIRIFIKNDYLILERGNLYHSLYDLKNQKVIINEESPWHQAKEDGKEGLNQWIKENLHDKIKNIIKV